MFKRGIVLFLLTIVSMFFLSGCFPTGMIRAESNSGDEKTVYEIADEIENLTLSLTLPGDAPPQTIPKLRVACRKWDKDKLCEIFLGDKTIIEQKEYDLEFENEKYNIFKTADSELFFDPGRITYRDLSKEEYGYSQLDTYFDSIRFDDQYTYAKECNFPLSDATITVNAVLDKIGIRNYALSEVWAITADTANDLLADKTIRIRNEDKTFDSKPYLHWTSDDEAYVLRYSITYENIPVMTRSAHFVGEYMPQGTVIDAVVTKDKIVSFTCENIFSMEYEIKEPVSAKVSAESALKDILQNFSKRVLQSPNEIFDAKLVYAPFEWDPADQHYILMPMWEFDYGGYDPIFKGLFRRIIYVDIQTGNRFDTGS